MSRLALLARWSLELLLPICVFISSLYVFFDAKAKFDSDEGNKVGTTRYFETFFIDRDFSDEAWADSHWTRTQPMVFRYVIGSWLWWRGHDLQSLNPNYEVTKSYQANKRLGQVPPDEVLEDARAVTKTMAALAVTVLYLIVRVLAGPAGGSVGGLVAAIMAMGSPYLEENLIRAKAESILMFFLLGALLFAILSLQRAAPNWPGAGWGILTGIFLGLAFGTKLTAVLIIIAVALWGAAACLDDRFGPWVRWLPVWSPLSLARGRVTGGGGSPPDTTSPVSRRGAPWVWPAAVLITTAVVFVGSNPYTWPNPVQRTWILFEYRRFEMSEQQRFVPSRAIYDLRERASTVWERSVWNDAFAPSRLNQPVEAVLTVIGAVWLAILAVRSARNGVGPGSVELLVFLWLGLLWAGVSAGLGFLLQHYFVPTAMTAILLSGLVIGWSIQAVWKLVQPHLPALSAHLDEDTSGILAAAGPGGPERQRAAGERGGNARVRRISG
ncbi:MAG: ArnT family glycosyltransferase [Chloroflexota bacterium]